MILKEGAKFYRVQSLTKQLWNWKNRKQCIFLSYTLLVVFLALFFDISRMGGAIYETAGRLTGYIKGPCISYDTTTQKLFTTPHNTGCANYADSFIIISAIGIILLIFIAACGYAACGLMPDNTEQKQDAEQHEFTPVNAPFLMSGY